MLLMIEKGKIMIKILNHHVIYLDANNLYGWGMSQKLPVKGFKLIKKLSKFEKNFIKTMMKIVIKAILLEQMLNIQYIL